MKKFRRIFIFGIIEIITLLLFEVKNLELFFMIWTFFSIAIIGYAILNDSKEFIRSGNVGTSRNNDMQHTRTYFAQKMGESVSGENKKVKKASVDYLLIISLPVYLVINIVCLILFST